MTEKCKRLTIADELLDLACAAYTYETARWRLCQNDAGGWMICRAYVFGDNPANAISIEAGQVEEAARKAFTRKVNREAMEAALCAVATRRRDVRPAQPMANEVHP
jgi:hypothetical protein